jgi:hypothetical protein
VEVRAAGNATRMLLAAFFFSADQPAEQTVNGICAQMPSAFSIKKIIIIQSFNVSIQGLVEES